MVLGPHDCSKISQKSSPSIRVGGGRDPVTGLPPVQPQKIVTTHETTAIPGPTELKDGPKHHFLNQGAHPMSCKAAEGPEKIWLRKIKSLRLRAHVMTYMLWFRQLSQKHLRYILSKRTWLTQATERAKCCFRTCAKWFNLGYQPNWLPCPYGIPMKSWHVLAWGLDEDTECSVITR